MKSSRVSCYLSIWLNTMFQAIQFPACVSNLNRVHKKRYINFPFVIVNASRNLGENKTRSLPDIRPAPSESRCIPSFSMCRVSTCCFLYFVSTFKKGTNPKPVKMAVGLFVINFHRYARLFILIVADNLSKNPYR